MGFYFLETIFSAVSRSKTIMMICSMLDEFLFMCLKMKIIHVWAVLVIISELLARKKEKRKREKSELL